MKNHDKYKPTKFIIKNKSIESGYKSIGSYLLIRNLGESFNKILPLLKNKKKILDIGCGQMPYYIFFNHISPDCYIGVDWENSLHGNLHADFVQDISVFDWEKDEFDLILVMDVFEHSGHIDFFLNKIFEKLQADGLVVFSIPFMYWIHEKPYDMCRYSEFYIDKISDNIGFVIEKKVILGGSFFIILDILSKKIFAPFRLNFRLFKHFIYYLNKFLIKITKDSSIFPIEYIYVLRKK